MITNYEDVRESFIKCGDQFRKVADTMKPHIAITETASAIYELGIQLAECGIKLGTAFDSNYTAPNKER